MDNGHIRGYSSRFHGRQHTLAISDINPSSDTLQLRQAPYRERTFSLKNTDCEVMGSQPSMLACCKREVRILCTAFQLVR